MWAIGSNVDKVGVLNSSPIFWSVMVNLASALILFPIMLAKSYNGLGQVKGKFWTLLPIGLSLAMMYFFQMKALSIQQVVYVISIKRTSVLISVLFGYFFLKEQGIKERLFAASIMVAGVILILNS